MKKEKALVVFSGGQDSTTCLYLAKGNFEEVHCLNINYGQRHIVEMQAAECIAKMANVPYKILNIDLLKEIGDSALLKEGNISDHHRSSSDLPASFVPGRNIILLTAAAMHAYKMGIRHIITGVCQTDFSGYPDCRKNTISSLQDTLSLGMEIAFEIHTPLMYLTKAESVILAEALPGCMEALAFSHTCYEGQIPPCGKCPACVLRQKGFDEAGTIDPLIKRTKGE